MPPLEIERKSAVVAEGENTDPNAPPKPKKKKALASNEVAFIHPSFGKLQCDRF